MRTIARTDQLLQAGMSISVVSVVMITGVLQVDPVMGDKAIDAAVIPMTEVSKSAHAEPVLVANLAPNITILTISGRDVCWFGSTGHRRTRGDHMVAARLV